MTGERSYWSGGLRRRLTGLGSVVLLLTSVMTAAAAAPTIETAKLTASDGFDYDHFGASVAVAGDTLVVGSRGGDAGISSGSVYVFSRSGSSWVESARLTASDGVGSAVFGASVAIAANTLAIGAPWDDDNGASSGSVYVFSRSGDSWVETAKLTASDGRASDLFGYSVALDGDTLAVGATQFLDGAGSAYVFSRYGDSWVETGKLTASDGATADGFGFSVAVSGDAVVVGAPRDDDRGTSSGSAYLFAVSGGSSTEEMKWTASDGAAYDRFGWSVAADGDTVVIGAFGGDGNVKDSGSAYVFVQSGGDWAEDAELAASDGSIFDEFGGVVATEGGMIVVGAHLRDEDGLIDSGASHVFTRANDTWTEVATLTASDIAAADRFGSSVAASDGTVVVAATGDDDNGPASGSVYVFELSDPPGPAACTIVGTAGDDELIGTAGADVICGRGGNDIIYGKGGDDVLRGGSGSDRIVGGRGADTIIGNGGGDRLVGGAGDDLLRGGAGQDVLRGNRGNDMLKGNRGDDSLSGGPGNDALFGGKGTDACNGGLGSDTFAGCE